MRHRQQRVAECGPGAVPRMMVLGDGRTEPGDTPRFFQVWNPSTGDLKVFLSVDGVIEQPFEDITAFSTGKLHAYPGDDVAIGGTNSAIAPTTLPFFIIRS